MAYKSRITADAAYLQAVGQAFYNFAYLEWIVIWTIVKLAPNGFQSAPEGEPSFKLATSFTELITTTVPALHTDLRDQLLRFAQQYREAIQLRDNLLYSHPFTAADGTQQLGGPSGHRWPADSLNEAAKAFEDAASFGNSIFYGALAEARSGVS